MRKVFILICCVLALQSCNKDNTKNETINGFDINWTGDLGKKEKDAVRDMISNMVKVESGTFYMGAQKDSVEYHNYDENATSLEAPVHEVTVSEFYINKYEVTQLLWESIMGDTPNDESDMQWEEEYGKGDKYPAYRISFKEVETFIGKLNEYTGLNFDLPTEAQWEFAARGGVLTNYALYAGGDNLVEVAWVNCDKSNEVGMKSPNALGLYDMSGNVWEMCQDWYYDYTETSVTDPVGEEYNEGYKVFRGGSWKTNAQQARVTTRYRQGIHYRDYETGFRLIIK
ncbi:MAG: formylglycine-generating enzyme family protein [Lentimicrobiaceae bacterium]|nr:formylglycine-generating enzyme family protein [Lentimicrobiaceae bacterium]